MNATVYILGILLQLTAAVIALVQVRRVPRKLPWLLIALSSLLIVARRSATLNQFTKAGQELAAAEVLTLIISLLFFLGVILMTRMFRDFLKVHLTLKRNEERYALALRGANEGLWDWELDTDKVIYSPQWKAMLGFAEDEIDDRLSEFERLVHPEDRQRVFLAVKDFLDGKSANLIEEIRMRHKDGRWVDILSRGGMVRDEDNRPRRLIGTNMDITGRKRAEEKIQNLLAEKETLLKEVHHRIKNNMGTMMSLLSLQSELLEDPAAIAALQNAMRRMLSMGVLYDKLYRSENLKAMSVKEYLSALADEVVGIFPNRAKVKVEGRIDDFELDVKILSPLGIIVNELITNAMKYAFSGRDEGVITLSASRRHNHATLVIGDNGAGIPESVDIENSHGFGLRLVGLLTKQIGGTMKIERGQGTRFVLEFDA